MRRSNGKRQGTSSRLDEFYVPEMLISARAMQAGLAILKPYLKEANISSPGKIVIGTVKGDLHDIGKNLVAMMLEGAGIESRRYGFRRVSRKLCGSG